MGEFGRRADEARETHSHEHEDQHPRRGPAIGEPPCRQSAEPDQERSKRPELDELVVGQIPLHLQSQDDHEEERGQHVHERVAKGGEDEGQSVG